MKKILAAVLLLCASVCAYGQGATILFPPVTDPQGHGVPFVTINFCTTPTTVTNGVCNTPVTVFQNSTLSTPYSSAIQTDGLGNFPPNVNTATAIWFSPAANYCYSLSGSITATNICYPFSVPIATGSSPTFVNITAQSYDNIQTITSLTSGVDICAKIATAIAALPSPGGGTVDARFFQGTQACASNPIATVTVPLTLRLGDVTIQSSVQWLQNNNFTNVIGNGPGHTILQYTGASTPAFIKISTATPTVTFIRQIKWMGMTIKGSANVTDTFYISGVHNSWFEQIDFKDATQSCFHSQFAVTDTYKNLSCTNQTGPFVTTPAVGLFADALPGSLQTTDGTVTDFRGEGIGQAIYLKSASSMTFTSGTGEANSSSVGGVQIDATSSNNIFIGTDFEANSGGTDVFDNGTSNIFIDIIANDTTGANMGPTSNGSQVIGGNVPTIVKNASATNAGGVQSSAKQIGTSSGGANASGLQMIAATPGFALENTGGAADAKWWDCIVAGGSFVCRTLTDAFGLGSNWMTVNRTAGPVTSMSFGINGNVQTMPTTTGTLGNVIVSGTSTFTTTAATTGTCQTTVTTAATGALTTDAIEVAFATAPVAATDGMLILQKYVTAGNVNFMRCNPTAGTITPTALVLNWRVIR